MIRNPKNILSLLYEAISENTDGKIDLHTKNAQRNKIGTKEDFQLLHMLTLIKNMQPIPSYATPPNFKLFNYNSIVDDLYYNKQQTPSEAHKRGDIEAIEKFMIETEWNK